MQLMSSIKNNIWDKKSLYLIINGDLEKIEKIKDKGKRHNLIVIAWIYFGLLGTMIILSLLTLIFSNKFLTEYASAFYVVEIITVIFLIIDYALKLWTAGAFISNRQKRLSYFLFPFRPLSLMLIFGIIPVLYLISIGNSGNNQDFWTLFRILKLVRIVRILTIATMIPSLGIFTIILRKNKSWLIILFFLVIVVVLLFALAILTAENSYYLENNIPYAKRGIHNYWESIYYCVVSITTIGFGDVVTTSNIGRGITVSMAAIGVVLLTLPTSLIAGSFITELHNIRNSQKNKDIKLSNGFLHSNECKCKKCDPNPKKDTKYIEKLMAELDNIKRKIEVEKRK